MASCTFSPFSQSEVDFSERLTIRGSVQMGDGSSPADVFVWLEGLNVSAWTDEAGAFELRLPTPSTQPGGGLSGEYDLYFYVGNFGFEKIVTVLQGGYVVFGEGDIDDDGDVEGAIVLQKLADISTVMEPDEISRYDEDTRIDMRVSIRTYANPLRAEAFLAENRYILGYFFRKVNVPVGEAIYPPVGIGSAVTTLSTVTVWETGFTFPYCGLQSEVAEYEVYPYVHIVQDGLPEGLIESIAEHAGEYHPDYLRIPIRQEPGYLNVVEFVDSF